MCLLNHSLAREILGVLVRRVIHQLVKLSFQSATLFLLCVFCLIGDYGLCLRDFMGPLIDLADDAPLEFMEAYRSG